MKQHTLDYIIGIIGLLIATAVIVVGLVMVLKRSYSPGKMLAKIVFTVPFVVGCILLAHRMGPYGPFLIVFMAVVLSPMWTPHFADLLAGPITNIFDGGLEPPEQKPFYSIALTKRNRGKPREAIAEIRRQLEKFPDDFEGIMLLARVQAEDLSDLPAAEVTLQEFSESRNAPMVQVAAAFTQLADWRLKLAVDVDAARADLQKIIDRYPESEAALHAEKRIAHLAEAHKVIQAKNEGATVAMPAGVDDVGLLDSTTFLKPQEIEPGRLAAAHVKHLESHPHDTEVREKLAILYARDFKRLDLATLELAQMINEPRHKPKEVAHWLNLLATLQVESGADFDTVRGTLQKIIDNFPSLPLASVAQRRLARLENEFNGLKRAHSVKLGSYEQNIGLKYGPPDKPG